MDKERSPVWPWIVALLVGLPVLYVASFGPACWLADRYSDRCLHPVAYVYRPFVAIANSSPEPIRIRVARYSGRSQFGMDMLEFITILYGERDVTIFGIKGGPEVPLAP